MGHRVNNGKQRTTLCWRASLYKNKLAQVSDTGLKLVIIMIRLKRAKYQTPIKSFSFWACVLVAWCSLFKWCGFNLPACCEFQWRYSLAPPEFIKLGGRRRVRILKDIWHTWSPYQSRSLFIKGGLIKQPRIRRHGAKRHLKTVFILSFKLIFITLISLRSSLLSNVGECFLVFNSKVMYLNVGKGKTIVF